MSPPASSESTIDHRVDRLADQLDRVTKLMEGEGTPIAPGVVGVLGQHTLTLDDHEKRLGRQELFQAKIRWTASIAAGIGSLAGGGLVYLITELIHQGGNLS